MKTVDTVVPSLARKLHWQGLDRLRAGRYVEARNVFDRAVGLEPQSFGIQYCRAAALLRLGHFVEAEAAFRCARSLHATAPNVHLGLIEALRAQRLYRDAESVALTAIHILSDNAALHWQLVKLRRIRLNPEGALAACRVLVLHCPSDASAWRALSRQAIEVAQPGIAGDAAARALALDPAAAEAHGLAALSGADEAMGVAQGRLEAALALERNSRQRRRWLAVLANLFFRSGDMRAAIDVRCRLLGSDGIGLRHLVVTLDRFDDTRRVVDPAGRATHELATYRSGGLVVRRITTEYADAAVTEVRGCQILGDGCVVVSGDARLLVEGRVHRPERFLEASHHVGARDRSGRILLELPAPERHIREPVVVLGSNGNFGHWMIDHFPQLWSVIRSRNIEDLAVIVNAPALPFQVECLERAGISRKRIYGIGHGAVWASDHAIVPTLLHRKPFVSPHAVEFLREVLRPNRHANRRRRLFLSRADTGQRRLINEDEIFDLFRPHGFERVLTAGYSLQEQIDMFAEAEAIAGAEGSAFANLVFAPEGGHAIAFATSLPWADRPDQLYSYWPFVAALCRQGYSRLEGLAIGQARGDFVMPVEAVRLCLRGLFN
ncbi:MAG: DUF563 domain-containing protein [Alphaproteobacteria bacterium]|nr:DUF563 domain-containing protein [Alphaproteobacteria bacterium]